MRPKQRIVVVAHGHRLGGIERHVVTLSKALAQRGHAIAYAGPADGWLGESLAADGHTCVDIAMKGMYDAWSASRLARFCRQWGATIVHGHAMRGGRYADWSARRVGLPAVVSAHSTTAWKWLRPHMHLIAVSEAVRRSLVERAMPAGRIRVVYNGVPDPASDTTPARAAPTPAPLRIGLIGRLDPVKGQDLALKALALLNHRRPIELLLAGVGSESWTIYDRAHVRIDRGGLPAGSG